MPAPYGQGLYEIEPPPGNGLNITDLFHIVAQKPTDPGIYSTVDSQYPNVAIITFDAKNQFGGMWAHEKLDLTLPFTTEIQLYLARKHNSKGNINVADGMTFTMHNDPRGIDAIGGAGEGLGAFKGRKWVGPADQTTPHGENLKNSLVIEFDTYQNLFSRDAVVNDPTAPHCALVIPDDQKIDVSHHRYWFNFSQKQEWKPFKASWMPNNKGGGTLTYSFENYERSHVVESIQKTFGGNKVYWGFTGATGEYTSVQAAAITRLPKQGVEVEKTVQNASGKDIDRGKAMPGDVLTYTIKVTACELTNPLGPISFEDILSPYAVPVGTELRIRRGSSETPVPFTYSGSSLNANTNIYLQTEGDTVEIIFDVKVNDVGTEGVKILNSAIIRAENLPEPAETNETEVTIYADVEKKVADTSTAGKGGAAVKLGDVITYEITYVNGSTAPVTVTVMDELDEGLSFVDAQNGGAYDRDAHAVMWTFDNVAAGTVGTVSLRVRVNENAKVTIENYAVIEAGDTQTETTHITNQVIPESPKKKIADTSAAGKNGNIVKPEELITYEISYHNYTIAPVAVVITDKLPAGVDYVISNPLGNHDPATNTVTWQLANIASGNAFTVSVTVRVNTKASGVIINYAAVKVGDDEPRNTNFVVNPVIGSFNCFKHVLKCRKTIKGKKTWSDNNNASGKRPPTVEIQLFRDDVMYRTVPIDSSGDGTYEFVCMPIWRTPRQKYEYRIDEAPVEGYEKTIDGYNIINTLL